MEFYGRQIEHFYPKNVHILDNPYLTHLAAKVSQENCTQPLFNQTIRSLFTELFITIINNEWPVQATQLPTRMTSYHGDQKLQTSLFMANQKAVCVDIARAGMIPSQIFFDQLNGFANPEGIRQDHFFAARMTNHLNQVTHTEVNTLKAGGSIQDAIVFLPDPMGATGKSLCKILQHYKNSGDGKAKKFISAHMIVTPEFIKALTVEHPDVIIYAVRVDRGFSSSKALSSAPGKYWDEEKGLNDNQYIVPGAGGVGELINNSYV